MSWGNAGDSGRGPCENPRSLSSSKAELNQIGILAKKLKKKGKIGDQGGDGVAMRGDQREVQAKTPGPYQVPRLS